MMDLKIFLYFYLFHTFFLVQFLQIFAEIFLLILFRHFINKLFILKFFFLNNLLHKLLFLNKVQMFILSSFSEYLHSILNPNDFPVIRDEVFCTK